MPATYQAGRGLDQGALQRLLDRKAERGTAHRCFCISAGLHHPIQLQGASQGVLKELPAEEPTMCHSFVGKI